MTDTKHPLRAKREAQGLSQVALEGASGVDRQRIGKMERGGRLFVRYADLKALGHVLDATPQELVGPGQAVLAETDDELAAFVGDHPVTCPCQSDDPLAALAARLGHDPGDPAVVEYLRPIVECLGASS